MNRILVMFCIFTLGISARADLSIECKDANKIKSVSLDLARDWYLSDPTLGANQVKLNPVNQTNDSVEFLLDFGSDSEKMSYKFEGLKKCGIYGSDVEVIKMTSMLKSAFGKTRNVQVQKCTCDED